MTRAGALGSVVTAGAIVAAAVTATARHHAAWAADPPGFPSGGSGAAGSAGSGAPPPPAPPVATDEDAGKRNAEIKKFTRDHEADPLFAQHEDPGRVCHIEHRPDVVTLTFNADGTLHCKLSELGEGYELEVYILTEDRYAGGNHYRITVTTGAPLKSIAIRGTSADVKSALEVISSHTAADIHQPAWWRAPQRYGPYHVDSAAIRVSLDEAGVNEDTKLAIAQLYTLNLAVVALLGPGLPSFGISDGKLYEHFNRADLNYYFGVHAYPLSWNRNGNRKLRPSRYFSDEYSRWYDRFSILAGVNLTHPTQGAYLGGAIEIYSGVSITAGWQPRKITQLQRDHRAGEAIAGPDLPTSIVWDLTTWGLGLSVDSTLLRPLLSTIGR